MKPVLFLALVILAACSGLPSARTEILVRAVYLVQGQGQLSRAELQAHPEVAVTSSFERVKRVAQSRMAIWIDVNAVPLVNTDWLAHAPQSHYPVVLVGDSSWLCSFRQTLVYFVFEEPPFECNDLPPGFSVNIQTSDTGGWGYGYEETPNVERILGITNRLLDGRLPNGNALP